MFKKILHNKNFLLLTTGSFISSIGDYLYNIGITIYLYNATKSIGSIALMWLSRGALRIPVQYLSGIIADKCNKKRVIVLTNLISAPIALLFIFVSSKKLWLVYLLAFLLQSLNDMDMCSENAILPKLVSKDHLSYCNSIFSFLESISIFLSPAIGGLIYKFIGTDFLFIINSLTFLISGVTFLFIRYNHENEKIYSEKSGIFKSGLEGYKILCNYSIVKGMFLISCLYGLMGRFYEIFKVAVSDTLLNMNAEGIIYFDYALAIGGLLTPLFIKLFHKHKDFNIYISTSLCISFAYIVFGFSKNYILTLLILVILGLTWSIQGVYSKTIIQKNIPTEYLGRVFSFYKILLTFFAIIGILISTPMYNNIGIGMSFLVLCSLSILLCVFFAVNPTAHSNK